MAFLPAGWIVVQVVEFVVILQSVGDKVEADIVLVEIFIVAGGIDAATDIPRKKCCSYTFVGDSASQSCSAWHRKPVMRRQL